MNILKLTEEQRKFLYFKITEEINSLLGYFN